jgi:transcriptional regulator with XRE-family HTH domain
MPARNEPALHGRRIAQRLRTAFGSELLAGRLSAGISQRSAGSAAGMSHTQFGRIERGELTGLTIDQAARAAAAIGLRLTLRTYPDGDPARDAAHLGLIERFRRRLPPGTVWRTEVPMPIPGDRRAWDGAAILLGRTAGCEMEMRLGDMQALERHIALKQRDSGVDVVVLVIADTKHNRRMLELHRDELRTLLPLDSRQVLDAFRRGELPERSGIVIV